MALIHFHHFQFDTNKGTLTYEVDGVSAEVNLRNKVALLLSYFLTNPNRVISKDELLEKLWQNGEYRESSLTQSIRELRKVLDDNAQEPTFIKTFPQRGYQWLCHLPEQATPDNSNGKVQIEKSQADLVTKFRRKKWAIVAALMAAFILLGAFIFTVNNEKSESSTVKFIKNSSESPNLIVLPIENKTQDPTMAWLELGLADMVATRLRLLGGINVIPPIESSVMVIEAGISWPTNTAGIAEVLTSANADMALYASVRLHGKLQVYDFQLIHSDGKTIQGSITYDSLPASIQSIAVQLSHLILPQKKNVSLLTHLPKEVQPIAAQATAEGLHLFQTLGPMKATQYFEAALKIEPDYSWAKAHLFRAYILTAQWQQASDLMRSISLDTFKQDKHLDAYVHYWLAEMTLRLGQSHTNAIIDTAVEKAEFSTDNYQLVAAYRLKALFAWQQMNWQEHYYWSNKAQHSNSLEKELKYAAEELFYLGSPANEGLEKNPTNDLTANQSRLTSALNFFIQLDNIPMIAASKLAISKNYTFPLDVRDQALQDAIKHYTELNQPYELAKSFLYMGFFNMQLHQGEQAQSFFLRAESVIEKYGLVGLQELVTFYLAFANLDQGLDQSFSGRHLQNQDKLQLAITQLHDFLNLASDPYLKAGAYVFLGWAYSDLGENNAAEKYLKQAKEFSSEHKLSGVGGYAIHSYMRLLLELKRYDEVIELAKLPITSKLQLLYLARAYYELGQVDNAIAELEALKVKFTDTWQAQDEQRLTQYKLVKLGKEIHLNSEPAAHVYYCESDWNMDSILSTQRSIN